LEKLKDNKKIMVPVLIVLVAAGLFIAMNFIGATGPSGTVSSFYSAMDSGNYERMAEYVPAEEREEFKSEMEQMAELGAGDFEQVMEAMDISVDIIDEEITDGEATVEAELTISIEMMGFEETDTQTVTHYLEQEDGKWVIVDAEGMAPMGGMGY